jgi:hypothetical protein
MIKRIIAIVFIYACTAMAWFILSGIIITRTESQDYKLKRAIGELWGTKQAQKAPCVYYRDDEHSDKTTSLTLESSDIKVGLNLDHRKKGLLWYPTYKVAFSGKYLVKNTTDRTREIFLDYEFPAQGAIYDNFKFTIGGLEIENIGLDSGIISESFSLSTGETKTVQVSYESQGLDQWSYTFGTNVKQVKNFNLVLHTDFKNIDFPEESISPTEKTLNGDEWRLTWQYANLLTGFDIGMIMPRKLNPGPWVSKVTLAAPVSLFLFFFVLFVVTTVKKIKVHPMNYFFIGAAFFSFHLLLAYLVDHISIHSAFWICSAVSIFLTVSYMRLVVGPRFAFVETALWQLIYLVFFSYTFFFEGYTGLAITILCICTLFVTMQFTGKVDWDKIFAKEKNQKTPENQNN